MKTDAQDNVLSRGSIEDPVGEKVILGKKLKNAYAVETMQAAFNYYNDLYIDSSFNNYIVKPNLKYIKISPKTERDLIYLENIDNNNDEIFLSNYPLDYEVIQEGSEYVDEDYDGKLEFKPLYTVIQIDETLDVPYEVLEKLYEPTEEQYDIETIALAMSDWQDDLIADFDQEVTMENIINFINPPNTSARFSLFGRRYRPKGTIQMFIYDTGGVEGLMNAKIRTGRNFFWRSCYTNEVGYFEAIKKYRGKVRIRSAWRNREATLRMNWLEMLGIQVSDHVMTETRGKNDRTYVIKNSGEDVRLWCKGATHNGLIKYNKYCDENRITGVYGANIWVWKGGGTSNSTPMLKRYPAIATMASINGWSQSDFWSSFLLHIGGNFIQPFAILFNHLMPDQIYQGVETRTTDKLKCSNRAVEQVVFHESGHFSHALNCGSWNYSKIVAGEVKNSIDNGDPYYDGHSPNTETGRQIALAEGWANFIENKCANRYYGKSYQREFAYALPSYMENFRMYKSPLDDSLINEMDDNDNWFLSGLLWDINDDHGNESQFLYSGSGNQTNILIDNLYFDSSLYSIYSKLESDVYSGYDLKAKLLNQYPTETNQINQLFTSYGY